MKIRPSKRKYGYDYPPHVVEVRTTGVRTHVEKLAGELVLRDSDWDPYTALLEA